MFKVKHVGTLGDVFPFGTKTKFSFFAGHIINFAKF